LAERRQGDYKIFKIQMQQGLVKYKQTDMPEEPMLN